LYFIILIKSVIGCFIKKQKIPLPGCDQETGPYYKLPDLVVGTTVIFYGKELRITGVDPYTRDFLFTMGVPAKENEPIPEDPYFEYRKKVMYYIILHAISYCYYYYLIIQNSDKNNNNNIRIVQTTLQFAGQQRLNVTFLPDRFGCHVKK